MGGGRELYGCQGNTTLPPPLPHPREASRAPADSKQLALELVPFSSDNEGSESISYFANFTCCSGLYSRQIQSTRETGFLDMLYYRRR